MKREIKFRAKIKANGHWVVGSYIHDEHCPSIRAFGGGEPFIVPETLGQFTTISDKYGKEIYEGDIVKWKSYATFVGEVVFDRGLFEVLFYDYGDKEYRNLWGLQITCTVEVVGNIHDNPELMRHED